MRLKCIMNLNGHQVFKVYRNLIFSFALRIRTGVNKPNNHRFEEKRDLRIYPENLLQYRLVLSVLSFPYLWRCCWFIFLKLKYFLRYLGTFVMVNGPELDPEYRFYILQLIVPI